MLALADDIADNVVLKVEAVKLDLGFTSAGRSHVAALGRRTASLGRKYAGGTVRSA